MEQAEVKPVGVLEGFTKMTDAELEPTASEYGLAMNADDLREVVKYFRREGRDPYETELRILDTYWSDHCRHTTFTTELEGITVEESFVKDEIEDSLALYLRIRRELGREHKSICLMDMATIGARYLRKKGLLDDLEVSDENNACSVYSRCRCRRADREVAAAVQERNPQPSDRDRAVRRGFDLSGRRYPRPAVGPQLRLSGDARDGRGQHLPEGVRYARRQTPAERHFEEGRGGLFELRQSDRLARPMCARFTTTTMWPSASKWGRGGAVKAENVRREKPAPGDKIIMLGGRTGRDGIGGATGSSKEHNTKSLETCGSEVQKGNAPEERKLERCSAVRR